MKVLHINKNNVDVIKHQIQHAKHVFLLIYMDGCGPCMRVRPEWSKIENILRSSKNQKYTDVVLIDIEKDHINDITFKTKIKGFPTMKYISNKGANEENYEEARDVTSLMSWINSKVDDTRRGGRRNKTKKSQKTTNKKLTNKKLTNKKLTHKKLTKKRLLR